MHAPYVITHSQVILISTITLTLLIVSKQVVNAIFAPACPKQTPLLISMPVLNAFLNHPSFLSSMVSCQTPPHFLIQVFHLKQVLFQQTRQFLMCPQMSYHGLAILMTPAHWRVFPSLFKLAIVPSHSSLNTGTQFTKITSLSREITGS